MEIHFQSSGIVAREYCVYGMRQEGNFVISPTFQPKKFSGEKLLWLLPTIDAAKSYLIECDSYNVVIKSTVTTILIEGDYKVVEYRSTPHCDFLGNKFDLDIDNGDILCDTYAEFYWKNLLPQMAERTFMLDKPQLRDGYVLSTLDSKFYGGTYPSVDFEFHIKGRLAVGGKVEQSLIKRMLQLQLKVMREDASKLSRNVCAIQPNGNREYDVWRDSLDHKVRAQMFRITANIEFVEEVFNYYCMSKDKQFVIDNLQALEQNCKYIESFINSDNLLCSHVYYEDQVIKDGCVLQAQALAVKSFRFMSRLEDCLGSGELAKHYGDVAERLGNSVGKDFPRGYWDNKTNRFIDWIDSRGVAHDHIHLLSNQLPSLLGLATIEQSRYCMQTIKDNQDVFDKFPSFVAAKIEDYTKSEVGTGGYYDLCAAGRYWCHDADYLAFANDGHKLLSQLMQVAVQANKDNFLMGERYDMNYIYYNRGKQSATNWHGSSMYYEYPNVFIKVLINNYLGVAFGFDSDVSVKPQLVGNGKVVLQNFGIEYSRRDKVFTLKNISSKPIKVQLDLSGLGAAVNKVVCLERGERQDFNL